MIFDNPSFVANASFPPSAVEGQTTFITGVGLHQFINGQWTLISGSGAAAPVLEAIAQKRVTSVNQSLYVAPSRIVLTELTLVTETAPVEITIGLRRNGVDYKIFDRAYFEGYITTIIGISVPLQEGDELFASATNGSGFSVTMTGTKVSMDQLIVLQNTTVGSTTLYTAPQNMTITNVILCNTASGQAETSLNIKRESSTEDDAVFLNQLLTQAGEVIMGDLKTAIDEGSTIRVTTNQPVTILITAH